MSYIIDLVRGLLIGIANIIPGISGGTFALLLGIYERLINAIGNLNQSFIKDVLKGKIGLAVKKIDFWFLMRIFIGAVISIVLLSRVIEYFLERQHEPTYAFFVGLIIPSIAVPWKMMQRRKSPELIWFLIGLIFLLSLSIGFGRLNDMKQEMKAAADSISSASLHHPLQLLYAVFCGSLAISAMILPGISGSFVMLILGQYKNMIHAINSRDFIFIGALGIGAILGAIIFTRLLKLLLKKFHSQTIAFLIGLMLASLYTLWPFKKINELGKYTSINILPEINSNFWLSLLFFGVGFFLVTLFLYIDAKLKKE